MNINNRMYHQQVLSTHNSVMYSTLIHPHSIRSETLKQIDLKNSLTEDTFLTKGFFAVKDRCKYWITPQFIDSLPVRVEDEECDEYTHQDDVVLYPRNPKIFKITPEECFKPTEFLDHFMNFKHSNQTTWDLIRIIGIALQIGRGYVCLATNPSSGKTSVFDTLHSITDTCPVFKPRSVPGVLHQITGTGNMVFDDVLEARKDVREIMEEMCLQIGGWRSIYINGALHTVNTKKEYSVTNQSITFLYNRRKDYSNPDKKYFDIMFENNGAIDNRFLKVMLNGVLEEDFKVDFNISKTAEEHKLYYIKLAKYFLWLMEEKAKNNLKKRYTPTNRLLTLKGRRKDIFENIDIIMQQFAKNSKQYNDWHTALELGVIAYQDMFQVTTDKLTDIEEKVE